MRALKLAVNNELEFIEISKMAKKMGYIFELEFQHIPSVKCLFLKGRGHASWSPRPLSYYVKTRGYTKTSLARLRVLSM